MDLSKNNRLSAEEAINYIPHTGKRKKVSVCQMLESYPNPPPPPPPLCFNFMMETEDNNIQSQLCDSSIIYVGPALSIRNDFLTLYCHKELHQR